MKIFIEALMREEIHTPQREIEVYCFSGKPKIFVNVRYGTQREISVYDENFKQIDLVLHPDGRNEIVNKKADDYINQTFDGNFCKVESNEVSEPKVIENQTERTKMKSTLCSSLEVKSMISMKEISRLSIKLARNFSFVRCDWIVFNNRLYFNELTFTPYSGMIRFDRKWNKKMGDWLGGFS